MKKILIVEDNKELLELLTVFFEKYNCKVYPAYSAVEVEKILKNEEKTFELVISDIKLTDFDGYELLKDLKRKGFFKNTPIIIISALTKNMNKSEEELARMLNVNAFLSKPFSLKRLEKVLSNIGFLKSE